MTKHYMVATSRPGLARLDDEIVGRSALALQTSIAAVFPGTGSSDSSADILKPGWLAPGEAFEIGCWLPEADGTSIGKLINAIRSSLRTAQWASGLDINFVAGTGRKKSILVADMESTIIEQECLDELGDFVGLRPQIEAITNRAMRGELDFEEAVRARVALLAGLETSALETVYERVTLMPGASALVATMNHNGAYCALVSGGFTWFTEKIAARLGFATHQANVLGIEAGHLDGRVIGPILGRAAKCEALQRIADERRTYATDAIAVGDGANDLDMIATAGMGIAFRAKPKVAEAASIRIDYGDLTALLYLQGYRRQDIIYSALA